MTAPNNDVAAAAATVTARGRAADALSLRVDSADLTTLSATAPMWTKAATTGAQLVVEAPLTLGGEDLEALAKGTGTQPWTTLGTTLRSVSAKPAVVRLTTPDGADPARAKAAAERVAATVKAAAPNALIEWAAPLGTDPETAAAAFPGDAIDLIGLSIPADKPWPVLVTGKGGLTDWSDWAASKGKRLGISWTIGRSTSAWQVSSLRSWLDITANAKRLAVETVTIAPDADAAAVAAYNAAW
ncbi:MAG: hypothetical protein IPK37_12060 [Austwickia sp.]|nr:MAG: hypothetical protein IPK37_12060 [Austwickia sp.]